MAKSVKKVIVEEVAPQTYERPNYEPSELVIKEMMGQKNCSREKAIEILKNPSR